MDVPSDPRRSRRRIKLPVPAAPPVVEVVVGMEAPADPGPTGAPADANCSLCPARAQLTRLVFLHEHVQTGECVVLNIRLCESCGNRIEKHLKRAIPKRLMTFRGASQPLPQP